MSEEEEEEQTLTEKRIYLNVGIGASAHIAKCCTYNVYSDYISYNSPAIKPTLIKVCFHDHFRACSLSCC